MQTRIAKQAPGPACQMCRVGRAQMERGAFRTLRMGWSTYDRIHGVCVRRTGEGGGCEQWSRFRRHGCAPGLVLRDAGPEAAVAGVEEAVSASDDLRFAVRVLLKERAPALVKHPFGGPWIVEGEPSSRM